MSLRQRCGVGFYLTRVRRKKQGTVIHEAARNGTKKETQTRLVPFSCGFVDKLLRRRSKYADGVLTLLISQRASVPALKLRSLLALKFRSLPARRAVAADGLTQKPQHRLPVLGDQFHPGPLAHLREVDAAEEEARHEVAEAITDVAVAQGLDHFGVPLRAVGGSPGVSGLRGGLLNRHLQGRVRHHEGREVQPVFRTRA